MQTNSTCPSSSNNITAHGGTGSGSDPNACGSAEKNSTNTNVIAVDDQQEEMTNWSHACPYCTKSFESSQALGGHQNAHRRERDADRREYLASRRAQRMAARTIMAAAHHNARSSLPMLPHGASLYGSSSAARGYGYRYGSIGHAAAYNGGNIGFVHHNNKSAVYVGVPVQGPCPYCRRWFGNQQLIMKQQAVPIEYKFIPPYETNFLGGIWGRPSSSSSSSSASAATVIVLDGDEEHEVEVNMTKQRRLDLTLRL